MNLNPLAECLALLCDERGIIQKVICDDMVVEALKPGEPLGQFIETRSRIKLFNFLVELRAKGVAFEGEINIAKMSQGGALRLVGVIDPDRLLIVFAYAPLLSLNFLEETQKISHAAASILRTAIVQITRVQGDADHLMFDEISRLNNELITVQRELAKKNAELESSNTEIRRLNADLEQRVKERTALLLASNQELETFAYTISHDLRSPLRALDGYSTILIEDYQEHLDQDGRHYLARIRTASRRMDRMIEDLLNLSKVTRSELIRQTLDLSRLAHEIFEELQAQDPQHQVEMDISPNLVVDGDADLLKVLIRNLLNNAIKFSHPREIATIQFGASDQTVERVYFVRDHGVGFDMAYAGKLFAPFQRLHTQAEFSGNGIGLVTAYRIIARHGGRIWPEAEVGRGATFFFTLGK